MFCFVHQQYINTYLVWRFSWFREMLKDFTSTAIVLIHLKQIHMIKTVIWIDWKKKISVVFVRFWMQMSKVSDLPLLNVISIYVMNSRNRMRIYKKTNLDLECLSTRIMLIPVICRIWICEFLIIKTLFVHWCSRKWDYGYNGKLKCLFCHSLDCCYSE